MRIVYFSLIILLFTSCFSGKRDSNSSDKDFITQYIKKVKAKGEITKSPLIVIDGNVFQYSIYKKEHKPLMQSEIKEINYLRKNSQSAYDIFGKIGKPGVIVVTTTSVKEPKTLFLLDDKEISLEEFLKIKKSDMESFEIIKNKEDIKKYTADDYDDIWIVKSKKKKL
jgi:hypothetical protein